jgi:phosphohistidine phosphatase
MEIYLLRHGAAERTASTGRDADRQLTDGGVAAVTDVVMQARQARLNPSVILSSPYVRAIETAKVAARLLDYEQDILTASALTPESTPQDVWEELRLYGDSPSILAVKHEPLISAAACWMLGSTRAVEFAPGMMVRIDCDNLGPEPRGVLRRTFISK